MPTIKQKTIGGETYKLTRYPTSQPGKKHEYTVVLEGSGRVGDPVYTKRRAERQFRETVQAVRRAEGEDRNKARGPSLPGMGDSRSGDPRLPGVEMGDGWGPEPEDEPTIPGMGIVDTDGDGDAYDDDQPSLPFF